MLDNTHVTRASRYELVRVAMSRAGKSWDPAADDAFRRACAFPARGIGGALLSQEVGAFSFSTFDPFSSLRWFMVVIVAGVSSIPGAIIGAVAYVGLNLALFTVLAPRRPGIGYAVFGIVYAAVAIGVSGGAAYLLAQRRHALR